jgi:serine phosphatase RsbU (regulator of sigma subunit)/anti-sigma regulatory factor (Ser/Thr protein kinase)
MTPGRAPQKPTPTLGRPALSLVKPAAGAANPAPTSAKPSLTLVGPAPRGRAAPGVAPFGPGSPRRRRSVLSIRWIATTVAVVLTVTAVLGVGAVSERNARAALGREIRTRLLLEARSLATSSSGALLSDYPELTLHPLIRKLCVQQPELGLVVVVDRHSVIQGHADARSLGGTFEPPGGFRSRDGADPLSRDEALRVAGPLLVARAPVLHPGGQVIGAAYVGLPRRYIDSMMQASRRDQALLLALLTALGAAAAFVLMSQLLRPVGALRAGLERIGRGDLDTPIRLRDRTELGLLAETVNDMAGALKRAQAEMLERERLAHEVELAREIQHSLLPSHPVSAGPFDIRGDQSAAAEVGGDYWDVLPLPDGRIGLAVADVAGKGLAGCLVMSMLSALLRALRTTHASPAALLGALDERLAESLRPGVFVTMCYGILDPATGRLTFASAGHNPLVVWRRRSGELEVRASKGIPIGAIRGGAARATLRDETVQLEPGDVCLQFTDGYTEAFRAGTDEQFGLDRLKRTLLLHAPRGGEAVLTALREEIRAWSGDRPPSDDETLLIITCESGSAPLRSAEPAETRDEAEVHAAVERLGRARRLGCGVELHARLDRLAALDGWSRALPELAALPAERVDAIAAGLYEACANIVEHGCDEDGRPGLEVWWLPGADGDNGGGPTLGQFVIRDGGRPFRPRERRPTDFRDPAVRSRGRGLGLEIIYRAMARVSYHPATPHGNITVLAIGPRDPQHAEEELRA